MSDNEENPAEEEKPFSIDRAKQGRAACKKCKGKCPTGELRIAKLMFNPFAAGKMKSWHHVHCIFEQFLKQRVTTKRIESANDLDGWDSLSQEDQETILKEIEKSEKAMVEKYGLKATTTPVKAPIVKAPSKKTSPSDAAASSSASSVKAENKESRTDVSFREFRKLVADISCVSSYTEKTAIVSGVFTKGNDGKGFKGDISQWCRLLLPGDIKRIYNLQSKQLIKLFSRIFRTDQGVMLDHLKQGDIGETIQHFFEESKYFHPAKKSKLLIQEVDDFLEELSTLTKEDEQMNHFRDFASKCTSNDLKMVIRLIKHDLRMNAGAKHILQGVHPDAYQVYQASKDLNAVITRCLGGNKMDVQPSRVKASINVMTAVQPMLAEACKSVAQAMKKCPNGIYAEIKYDGERVQLHKHGSEFKYFSRSLKPVLPHKVSHFKEFILKAFPHAKDLILDSEILMIDTITGKPLPFGSLGKHKKTQFKDANVCLFVFDCIYYNGESLVKEPLELRKKILKENMVEIPNRILCSEMEVITKPKQLSDMIAKTLEMGLEGLVLKDVKSIYEPGKRHWLKVKKDYLLDGAMADTADLIVLGAWYGTGRKAGMKSVFLMGCYDSRSKLFCTVTKVHTGHDDKTLEQLQSELKMVEIGSNPAKVPSWLVCSRIMVPDFVAEDPKQQPVWEITGAEFTQHEVHTADGISIRFPRVTKIREDKNWKTATTLDELKVLYQKSKENTDYTSYMDSEESSTSSKGMDVKEPKEVKKGTSGHKRKKAVAESPPSKLPKKEEPQTSSANINGIKIKDPLLNIFTDVKLLAEEGSEEVFEKWLRYFTAFGGVVLKPNKWKNATHVLHLEDTVQEQNVMAPNNCRHVIAEWIKDSISNGSLQDFRPYTVRWEPPYFKQQPSIA